MHPKEAVFPELLPNVRKPSGGNENAEVYDGVATVGEIVVKFKADEKAPLKLAVLESRIDWP